MHVATRPRSIAITGSLALAFVTTSVGAQAVTQKGAASVGLGVEEVEAHEELEHGPAEGFRQPRRVVRGPRVEPAVSPEATVGHE